MKNTEINEKMSFVKKIKHVFGKSFCNICLNETNVKKGFSVGKIISKENVKNVIRTSFVAKFQYSMVFIISILLFLLSFLLVFGRGGHVYGVPNRKTGWPTPTAGVDAK